MTLSVTVGDQFHEAAEEWGEARMMDTGEAMRAKAEQALLEIEHLVADRYEVEFEVEGRTIHHEPSDELAAFLSARAEETGLDEATVLGLYVELFARAFTDDADRPPNAPAP